MTIEQLQDASGYLFGLSKLRFRDGTEISPQSLTVIIGPNNAGKTRVLKDVANALRGSPEPPVVLSETEFPWATTIRELLDSPYDFSFRNEAETARWEAVGPNLCGCETRQVGLQWPDEFHLLLQEGPDQDKILREAGLGSAYGRRAFGYYFASRLFAFLEIEDRLKLLAQGNLQPTNTGPRTLLELLLYSGDEIEDRVHSEFRRTFGTDFVVDYSELARLRIVIGPPKADLPEHPRKLRAALGAHRALEEQGHGVRSFLALHIALEACTKPAMLIDEPEAFLHPPHARRIGELIASRSREGRQAIVATHSVEVLRGILSQTSDVQILRLHRDGALTRVTRLDTTELASLSSDPVLSSSRMLDGLFYKSVVVVEGDSDSRFYQAVASRLSPGEGPHFVNAGGKQTIPKLLERYRSMGVPAAAILDFDAVSDEGEFRRLLRSAGVEEASIIAHRSRLAESVMTSNTAEVRLKRLEAGVNALLEEIRNSNIEGTEKVLAHASKELNQLRRVAALWNGAKQKGRAAFPEELHNNVDGLLNECASGGLFLCPVGELEQILSPLIPSQDKASWLERSLRLLRELEVRPQQQPWLLMGAVLDWLEQRILGASGNANESPARPVVY